MHRFQRPRLELFVILVAVIAMIIVALAIRTGQEATESPGVAGFGQQASTAEATEAATVPVDDMTATVVDTATPTAAGTATVGAVPTLEIPDNALVRTEADAVQRAMELALGLGAEGPHVVEVMLKPMAAALADTNVVRGEPESVLLEGWSAEQLASPVWWVVMDGDQFHAHTCIAALAEADACPTGSWALMIFSASDGGFISITIK